MRHGGVRRSLQIHEILDDRGWQYVTAGLGSPGEPFLRIEEDSMSVALGKSQRLPKPYVAWPHNVEHLVASQFKNEWSRRLAERRELKFFRDAKHIVTISNYDSWYLAQRGIASSCLPYYPPKAIERELLHVRSKRAVAGPHEDVLLLGTCGNPPTAEAAIDAIHEYSKKKREYRLIVAGFRCERLAERVSIPTGVVLVGTIDDAELDGLLTRSRAALVHQLSGTGLLTRVAEFLVAGIPVVSTPVAARGYERVEGVTIEQDISRALECLSSGRVIEAKDSERYKIHVRRLADNVLDLYDTSTN